MTEYENGFDMELKEKLICRFCLNQDDTLTNIYSSKNDQNSQVALSLQIMACVSIEVFADDEMPTTICDRCRAHMHYCYQFKQMCRKADTLLKQVPLTGVWPNRLDYPKFPNRFLKGDTENQSTTPITAQTLKRKLPQSITIISPSKRSQPFKYETVPIEDMVVEFADDIISEEITSPPPKILNNQQTPIKILNKQTTVKSIEPVIRCSRIVKTDEDGKIEIVSEMIEHDDMETDPNLVAVETNVFPCNYCERSFPLRQLLDIHVANHVRDRKFHCKDCNKGFFSKYDLGKHVLIHTGEKPFKCVICEKAFSRSTLLRRHEKVHSDQPKFLCGFCERTFLSKDEWERHTQNHEKKRPFECETCGKSFAFKQGLERHEVVHSADQPYKCEHCDQGFSTQGKLARHLTAHAGDRPYPCRVCNKSYLLSHHLTRHMRSHKEHQQATHKCTECDQTFSKRDDLIAHSVEHATENLVCPLCKEQFQNADDASAHIRLHTENEQFACEFCDLIFLDEAQLHEHSDLQHMEEIEFYDVNDDGNQSQSEANSTEDSQTGESIDDGSIIENRKAVTTNVRNYSKPANTKAKPIKPEKITLLESTTITPAKNVAKKTNHTNNTSVETSPDESNSKKSNAPLPTLFNSSPTSGRATRSGKNVENSNSNSKNTELITISTRSNKTSPIKVVGTDKTPSEKASNQVTLTKFLTIKPKGNATSTPIAPNKQLVETDGGKVDNPKLVNMKIGDKLVKLQQVRMTKAQIEILTKKGEIKMRDGQMIFKKKATQLPSSSVSPKRK